MAPLPIEGIDFPIVQYADDTLLLLQADARQLVCLKSLLNTFATSTGLHVNYSKSSMIPINMSTERTQRLASTFGCSVGTLPFTYLGLPMGTTKPRIEDMSSLMVKIERRLNGCSSLLSLSGRLQLVNSVISPITTYAMCSIKLHKGVIDNIDSARKQCLWRGKVVDKKGGHLAAWPMVQKPKKKGGLGVINLRLQNDALLLKQLHKFYSRQDVPWVNLIWDTYYQQKIPRASREVGSFWWKDVLRLSTLYRGIARCSLGNGSTVLFWEDLWGPVILAQAFPNLYQAATNVSASVMEVMAAPDLVYVINLPLSQQAYDELIDLQDLLSDITYEPEENDRWSFIWDNDKYSSKKLYTLAFSTMHAPITFSWMWKSQCTLRIKVFAWLLLVDRLNTRVMLRRRNFNIQTGIECVLYDTGIDEDVDHLLFACPFATRC